MPSLAVRASASLVAAAAFCSACASSQSGVDSGVLAFAESVAQAGVPAGMQSQTSPTNGSVKREINGVAFDFTGAMTVRKHGRALFVGPALSKDNVSGTCAAQSDYLEKLAAGLGAPAFDAVPSASECAELLLSTPSSQSEEFSDVWSAATKAGDFSVLATYTLMRLPDGSMPVLLVDFAYA